MARAVLSRGRVVLFLDGFLVSDSDGLFSDFLTWIGVPDGTSVVSIELDDGRRLWQQPVGATAFFDFEGPFGGVAVVTAFDSGGGIIVQQDRQVHGYQQILDEILNEDPL